MSSSRPATAAGHRTRSTIFAAALVVSATVIGLLGYPSLVASSSPAALPQPTLLGPHNSLTRDHPAAPGEPPMDVPDGTTVFENAHSAVVNLDPELLRALRQAATDAGGDGVEFDVTSGWRSRKDQARLFREAVARYGSKTEAARWVARPGTSAHESGDAIDLGPAQANAWLSGHGATYGLCQIYRNEPWHYELRPDAIERGCPPMFDDPTQDPRMQR